MQNILKSSLLSVVFLTFLLNGKLEDCINHPGFDWETIENECPSPAWFAESLTAEDLIGKGAFLTQQNTTCGVFLFLKFMQLQEFRNFMVLLEKKTSKLGISNTLTSENFEQDVENFISVFFEELKITIDDSTPRKEEIQRNLRLVNGFLVIYQGMSYLMGPNMAPVERKWTDYFISRLAHIQEKLFNLFNTLS